jgi:hypothetical protein
MKPIKVILNDGMFKSSPFTIGKATVFSLPFSFGIVLKLPGSVVWLGKKIKEGYKRSVAKMSFGYNFSMHTILWQTMFQYGTTTTISYTA